MRRLVAPTAAIVLLLLAGCSSVPPVPPAASDAEAEEEVTRQLDSYWDALDVPAPKPDVSTIGYTTRQNWASVQVTCLQASGLPAREVSGGFAIDGDGDLSRTASTVAQWTCLREYPVDPRTTGFLSIAQIRYMYDYFVDRLAPCLELQGLAVPPAPDRDAYVGTVRAGIQWNPYFDADGRALVTPEELPALDAKCPPLPDDPFGSFRPFG